MKIGIIGSSNLRVVTVLAVALSHGVDPSPLLLISKNFKSHALLTFEQPRQIKGPQRQQMSYDEQQKRLPSPLMLISLGYCFNATCDCATLLSTDFAHC